MLLPRANMRVAFSLLLLGSSLLLASSCHTEECDSVYSAEQDQDLAAFRNPYNGTCEVFGGGGGEAGCGDYGGAKEPAPTVEAWGVCGSPCESLDEESCLSDPECRGIYSDGCPPDTLCDAPDDLNFWTCWPRSGGPPTGDTCQGIDAYECARHTECIAVHSPSASGLPGTFAFCDDEPAGPTPDPGSCVGEVICDEGPPNCPEDTIPGRLDGCWTGYCIPTADCTELPSCDALAEGECIERADCSPYYEGINCTCDGDNCNCEQWIYDGCQETP